MNQTATRRPSGILTVLAVCCALAAAAPSAATAAPITAEGSRPAEAAAGKAKVKVHAKLGKTRIKIHEKVQLRGSLDVLATHRADGSAKPETLVVQTLRAGGWVDLDTGSCRPNGSFKFDLSFSVAAQVKLRIHHPESELYGAASSEVVTLLVI